MRRPRIGEASELDLMAVGFLLPSVLYVVVMFIYPFLYGIWVSVHPLKVPGFSLANYIAFFSDEYQYKTVGITFRLAVPNTVVVVALSLFLAYNMRRGIWLERTITTILVLPISLGVILLGQGILGFYGGKGWLNQILLALGVLEEPLVLTHNYIGVMLSRFLGFLFRHRRLRRLSIGCLESKANAM